MKDKIIEILKKYEQMAFSRPSECADEILKIAEFEALCNPDIYEANMNDHLACQNCDELKGAICEIGALQDQLKDAENEIRQLNSELRSQY